MLLWGYGCVENAKSSEQAERGQQQAEEGDQVILRLICFGWLSWVVDEEDFGDGLCRQRMGEDLNDLEINELRGLEQNLDNSLKIVRERKVGYDFFFFHCRNYPISIRMKLCIFIYLILN